MNAEHFELTPAHSGSVSSVGYVGWSTNGGYGPFSTLHGLGLDSIVGAKLVNYKGDLVEASDELLKGIRGAGNIFGVIVELTIKVYPLKEVSAGVHRKPKPHCAIALLTNHSRVQMLVSTLIYESSDMQSVWKNLTEGIDSLTRPPALNTQFFVTDFPGMGKVLGVIATWVSDDHEQGRKLIDQIAGFGNCVVNMTEAKTAIKYAEDNEKLVTFGVYGRSYTLNVKKWTPTTVSTLVKYSQSIPGGGAMISCHSLRSQKPNEGSVFGAREDHHMVEIVSMTADPALKGEADAWGRSLLRELREQDGANVLDSAYISLLDYEDADLQKIYGRHFDTLVSLKKKYDPENVFKHAAPRISV